MKNFLLKKLITLIVVLGYLNFNVYADDNVIWKEDTKKITLGKYISIFEDKSGKLKLADILSNPDSVNFAKSDQEVPGYGITDTTFWVRFTVDNSTQKEIDLILEVDHPQFDEVEFFINDPYSNEFRSILTGDQYPFSSRSIEHYNFIFPIKLEANSSRQIYFRLVMNGPTAIPINLWDNKEFISHTQVVIYLFGIFLGLLGVMILYNLFVYFIVKDITYLYYVLLSLGIFFTTIVYIGLDSQTIFLNSPFTGEVFHHFVIILSSILADQFTIQFLNTKEKLPRFHRILMLHSFLGIFILPLPFLFHITISIKANVPYILSLIPIYLATGVYSYTQGNKAARLYLVSRIGEILGAIIFALSILSIFPDVFLTRYSIQIAAVFEVVVFSFALADKINVLKSEKEKALVDKLTESEKVASLSRAFEKFVPKQFLEYLDRESISLVELGDNTQRVMTILFCDIRSFTDLSEKMSPNDNFLFINEYLSRVGPLIRSHNGFIDKYIGDAIMALFPDNVESAIDSAISIQKEVKQFNIKRKNDNQSIINIGIGIHTGNLMLGTVGESSRMDTTVISDAVNLASRLEGLTKELNAPIIVSKIAFDKITSKTDYTYRYLGNFKVKGKKENIPLIEVIENSLDHFAPEKIQTKESFEKAMSLYENNEFKSAIIELESILTIFPQDKASQHYLQKCKLHIKS
ncbi:MAG: 7TM-DISM domain-containing protein [Leptospiraceae bacterium]|nr:7TM-DISM domain-containing protein [Leptospiraceae bacterium]